MHIFLIIVTETVLANDDIPWEVLKRRGHESVRKILLDIFHYITKNIIENLVKLKLLIYDNTYIFLGEVNGIDTILPRTSKRSARTGSSHVHRKSACEFIAEAI